MQDPSFITEVLVPIDAFIASVVLPHPLSIDTALERRIKIHVWKHENLPNINFFRNFEVEETVLQFQLDQKLDRLNLIESQCSEPLKRITQKHFLPLMLWVEKELDEASKRSTDASSQMEAVAQKCERMLVVLELIAQLAIDSEIMLNTDINRLREVAVEIDKQLSAGIFLTLAPIITQMRGGGSKALIHFQERAVKSYPNSHIDFLLERALGTAKPLMAGPSFTETNYSIFQSVPLTALLAFLDTYTVNPSLRVVDLGSGTGTFVVLLNLLTGTAVSGVELNQNLYDVSNTFSNLDGVSFYRDDINKFDLKNYDIAFIFTSLAGKQLALLFERVKNSRSIREIWTLGKAGFAAAELSWLNPIIDPIEEMQIGVFRLS